MFCLTRKDCLAWRFLNRGKPFLPLTFCLILRKKLSYAFCKHLTAYCKLFLYPFVEEMVEHEPTTTEVFGEQHFLLCDWVQPQLVGIQVFHLLSSVMYLTINSRTTSEIVLYFSLHLTWNCTKSVGCTRTTREKIDFTWENSTGC